MMVHFGIDSAPVINDNSSVNKLLNKQMNESRKRSLLHPQLSHRHMPRRAPAVLRCVAFIAAMLLVGDESFSAPVPIQVRFVEVADKSIRVGLPELSRQVVLSAQPGGIDGVGQKQVLYRGPANGQVITIPRVSKTTRDRLYDRFFIDDQNGKALGAGRYPNRLSGLSAAGKNSVWPKSIKGLQDIRSFDDANELGVAHATLNISITRLVSDADMSVSNASEFGCVVDGNTYYMNPNQVRVIDRKVRAATKLGINTVAIILCTAGSRTRAGQALVHPSANLQDSPTGVFAANLGTVKSRQLYRAVMGFLGHRYSRPDKKYGHIGGYIIGNEVQSHWYWHNLGEQPAKAVIGQYADQIRLSYYALRQHYPEPRVFISMDHYWTLSHGKNPLKAIPGRQFIDALAARIRRQGDVPWHVAFHPYPENLFQPKFWNDRQAQHAFDTPKITFKNIEVLLDYLAKDELLYRGKRRRVILSEQGFHAGETLQSEKIQAAAYAASFVRISEIEGIDAYILHRHVDHPKEGGLKLGLRRQDKGKPSTKRLIYDVFSAAGTKDQEAAFRFALPIIGIKQWSEMSPQPGPFRDAGF